MYDTINPDSLKLSTLTWIRDLPIRANCFSSASTCHRWQWNWFQTPSILIRINLLCQSQQQQRQQHQQQQHQHWKWSFKHIPGHIQIAFIKSRKWSGHKSGSSWFTYQLIFKDLISRRNKIQNNYLVYILNLNLEWFNKRFKEVLASEIEWILFDFI